MVGLVKRALYKTIGNGFLTWSELEEVLLDVEITLNNRPLNYVEDDLQLPVLTPSALLFGRPNMLPQLDPQQDGSRDLRKRARYLHRCKDLLCIRWTSEYLKALREKHNLKHKVSKHNPAVGDVVIIKSDERNRGKWKLGIVETLIPGRDQVVRAVRLRAGKSYLEMPVQHLFPLEVSCDGTSDETQTSLNVDAPAFAPKRAGSQVAKERIREIVEGEEK